MKTYKLYVCMPMAKFYVNVIAETVNLDDGRLDFYNESDFYNDFDLVASYPSQYTIIEKIIENEK